MKKKKKVLYFIVTLLQVGLLAGTYILNYFTVQKLGINRKMNYMSSKWEKNYPLPQIKVSVILVLAGLSVLIICYYLKNKDVSRKKICLMLVVMCILSVTGISYILLCSVQKMRAYYIISMMLAATAVLQQMKAFVAIRTC